MRLRNKFMVTAAAATVWVSTAVVGTASAAPKGNDNWLSVSGVCDGQEVQFLDPPGPGPTNFIVGGSVGVGMTFRATDLATGEVIGEDFLGRGLDEGKLTYCAIVFNDLPTPSGPVDVLLEVWVLVTPQGP